MAADEVAESARPALEIFQVAVGVIDANEWNPNRQSEIVAKATRESLVKYGFVNPVTLRVHPDDADRFQIINGEHRWTEAVELGYEMIPAVILELTDEDAKKLTIVLNETTGDPDVVLLGQLLAEMQEMDDFRVALPYTDAELEHLLSIGKQDWDNFDPGGGGDPAPPPDMKEIKLSFKPKDYDRFNGFLVILRKEYGIDGTSEVIFEAIKRSAVLANQG